MDKNCKKGRSISDLPFLITSVHFNKPVVCLTAVLVKNSLSEQSSARHAAEQQKP
jgi:hypothetical protein